MVTDTSKSAQLLSHAKELVKQYTALDAQNRPEYVYTARLDATDQEDCIVTRYAYKAVDSTIIIKRKEYIGTWITATMDI